MNLGRYASIEGQDHDLDLGPRSFTYKDSNQIFSETFMPYSTKFCMKAFRYKEMIF